MSSGQTFLGRLLRLPLHLIPSDAELRILYGPLRGKKWIAGAGNNACWVGTYEIERLRAFANAISPGATVYDIGANVGIYTLLAATKAGPSGTVYSFEPLDSNLQHLERHLKLNGVQNCNVLKVAVSNVNGMRRFCAASWDFSMGRLSPEGEIQVPSVTLDSCVYGEKNLRPPDVMKIDVEGAELEVLQGAERIIAERHPVIFVEVHGTKEHADCCALLSLKGYHVAEHYGWLTATYTIGPQTK